MQDDKDNCSYKLPLWRLDSITRRSVPSRVDPRSLIRVLWYGSVLDTMWCLFCTTTTRLWACWGATTVWSRLMSADINFQPPIRLTAVRSRHHLVTDSLYAMRVLRADGVCGLQTIYGWPVIIAKLMWAYSVQWGFTNASEKHRIDGFLRRGVSCGYRPLNCPTFEEHCTAAERKLFDQIQSKIYHLLYAILLPPIRLRHKTSCATLIFWTLILSPAWCLYRPSFIPALISFKILKRQFDNNTAIWIVNINFWNNGMPICVVYYIECAVCYMIF